MSFITDFKESNRYKHFLCAIPIGFLLTILCAIGCAGGMEFKDRQYSNYWDWKDFWFTVLGGLVGQILQIILIIILF
nr:MAG TPA: putative periplasmic lipoprotein [Crassvirales sp.]